MAATDRDALLLQMSADLRSLEKQMKRAGQVVDAGATKAERRFQAMNDNMAKATGPLRGAVDGLAGSLPVLGGGLSAVGPAGVAAAAAMAGFGVALQRAAIEAERLDDLATSAARVGVTAEALQELRHAAEATDVPVEQLQKALEGLNASIGAMQTGVGAGRMKKVFAELGIPPEQLASMRTAEDLLPLLADKLSGLGSTAAQVQLAKKLGVEELLPMLRNGSAGIAELRDRARELGLVMDESTVQASAEMNEQLRIVDERAKAATSRLSAEFIPTLVWLKETAADAAGALASMFGWLNRHSTKNPNFQIETRLKSAQAYRERANRIRNGSTFEAAMASGAPGLQMMTNPAWREKYAREAEAEAARIEREIEQIAMRQQKAAREAAEKAAAEARNSALAGLSGDGDSGRSRASKATGPTPEEIARTRDMAALREQIELAQAAANERNVTALQDQLDRLEKIAEYRREGLGLAEATARADSFIATRSLNREVAASRPRDVPGLVTTADSMRAVAEDLKGFTAEEQAALAETFRSAFHGGIAAAMDGGIKGLFDNLADRFRARLIDNLADELAGLAFGGGGGGGLLGKILGGVGAFFRAFGGGYAGGGMIQGPGTGTSDSVLARLSNGEFVVNAKATRDNLGLLQAINSGSLPRFAEGGLVSRMPSLSLGPISRAAPVQHISVDLRGAMIWEGEFQKIMAAVDQKVAIGSAVAGSAAQSGIRQDLARRQKRALY